MDTEKIQEWHPQMIVFCQSVQTTIMHATAPTEMAPRMMAMRLSRFHNAHVRINRMAELVQFMTSIRSVIRESKII